MSQKTVGEMAAAVSLLLRQKLGVKGSGLEAKLAHAGRRLPRRIRRRAAEIAEAEKREGNPKLARMTDTAALARAYAEVEAHLKKIDVGDRRRGAILGMLGSISISLIAVFAVLVSYLVWRGFL
ncbi:MAG: hypothetical protein OEM24_01900 [Paracoccaceae bacterium]|nr:hypothetical protein [Paracoccaceae bacterium]